jgi:hypothetical protein
MAQQAGTLAGKGFNRPGPCGEGNRAVALARQIIAELQAQFFTRLGGEADAISRRRTGAERKGVPEIIEIRKDGGNFQCRAFH